MNKFTIKSILVALTIAFSASALADAPSYTLPTDTKLVQFAYDKYETYTILARPLHVTDLEFGADEIILGKAIGDSIQWKVEDGGERHILIRPTYADKETSLTVITDKRVYHFTLRSSPDGGKWYQHVEWHHPDRVMKDKMYAENKKKDEKSEQDKITKTVVMTDVTIESFNTDYKITGSDEIKPVMVADDGKRTSIKFNPNQDLPAVFVRGDDKKYAMVNYDVSSDGRTIIVQRVVNQIFLKLGKKEVVIDRLSKVGKSSDYQQNTQSRKTIQF